MFIDKIFVKEPSFTEKEIQRLYKERAHYDPYGIEYEVCNKRLKELLEMKEMEEKPKFQVSGDTVVKVAAMVVVCGVIIFKEELVGPVTSKALALVTKLA